MTDRNFRHFEPFFAFPLLENLENQNFNIEKKHLEILAFYTFAPELTIIWCMIPEIWSATDIIFCHSRLFFALLPRYGPRKSKFSKKWKKTLKILSIYKHKWQPYDLWFLRHGVQQTEFFVILDPFTPLTMQKIKILKKWKTCLEISFHTCVP